jgi:hypothetical protein
MVLMELRMRRMDCGRIPKVSGRVSKPMGLVRVTLMDLPMRRWAAETDAEGHAGGRRRERDGGRQGRQLEHDRQGQNAHGVPEPETRGIATG